MYFMNMLLLEFRINDQNLSSEIHQLPFTFDACKRSLENLPGLSKNL